MTGKQRDEQEILVTNINTMGLAPGSKDTVDVFGQVVKDTLEKRLKALEEEYAAL